MTRTQAMAADYATYRRNGGRFDYETWAERYGDCYPDDEEDDQ